MRAVSTKLNNVRGYSRIFDAVRCEYATVQLFRKTARKSVIPNGNFRDRTDVGLAAVVSQYIV
jgi:hypothetical protein